MANGSWLAILEIDNRKANVLELPFILPFVGGGGQRRAFKVKM